MYTKYYNPTTNEILYREELSNKYNMAIAKTDPHPNEEWYALIDGDQPQIDDYMYIEKSNIVQKDDAYMQTYIIKDKSLMECKDIITKKMKEEYALKKANCVLRSSLGFMIDADEQAKLDIKDILTIMEYKNMETHSFRDLENNIHTNLTKDNFNTLLCEIAENSDLLYNQKWEYEQQINNASSIADLKNITIKFNYYGV